ncbi:MAG: hypothetical protein AAFP18_12860 [Bacteroidota bacterium]
MRRALLIVLGVPILCLVWVVAFPLSYGTGAPPDLADGIWMCCAFIVAFAQVTVFSLHWWVVAGGAFLAFHLRHRAQRVSPDS